MCRNAPADVEKLENKMRARLEWSDVTMLRAILVFLGTQGWSFSRSALEDQEANDLAEIREAVEYTSRFREPLEPNIQIVLYSRKYLSIGSEGYQKIWYKLHTSPDSGKWCNVLRICELVFSLPFSNAPCGEIVLHFEDH